MYHETVIDKEWKKNFKKEWEQHTAALRLLAYTQKINLNKIEFVDEEHKHKYRKKLKSDSLYLRGEE